MFPRAHALGLIASGGLVLASGAQAAVIHADSIGVSIPGGTNDSSSPYTDDVFLDSIVIGSTNYATQDSFRAVSRFEVLTGRSRINAEWGDTDTNSDGDDNPFVKAGYDPAAQESIDPTIQNATLLNAFNSLSLSEMSDGEGGGALSFRLLFSASLTDNDDGVDQVPEIMLFERGMNDIFDVKLITGGTFEFPEFSSVLQVNSNTFWNTGISVNTVEISGSQTVGFGGFDLNDFGISSGESVYGMQIDTTGGPDMNSFVLSAENPDDFGDPLSPSPNLSVVPLPAGLPLLLTTLGATAVFGRRRKKAAT